MKRRRRVRFFIKLLFKGGIKEMFIGQELNLEEISDS